MAEFHSYPLLMTDTVVAWDVACPGTCRHKSTEECTVTTHLVFPSRGVYVRHVDHKETVAEGHQVVFFNADEAYRVSHPVEGGEQYPSGLVRHRITR